MAQFEKATVGEKVAGYVESRKAILITIVAVVVVAVVAYASIVGLTSKSAEKGLSAIDSISYTLTENSSELSDEDLTARKETALSALSKYTAKGGVVGVRANMLSAEIAYSSKDYEKAASFWMDAYAKGKKVYTSSLVLFNAGSCYENLSDLDKAADCYEKASMDKDFLLASRALFELGRVLDAKGDKEGAVSAFKKVYDSDPESSWGKLSKTQLIRLGAE